MRSHTRRWPGIIACSLALLSASAAGAQDDAKLLKDFQHFVRINQTELAIGYARALLDLELSPAEFVGLVDSNSNDGINIPDRGNPELKTLADQLEAKYRRGRLDRARSPEEISRNIQLLTGDRRNRVFAAENLTFAGEYAAPQLLRALLDRANPELQAQIRQVFILMGKEAVIPLVTAMPHLDPISQETIVGILGDIPYTTSVPFIYDLNSGDVFGQVSDASQRAILQLTGVWNPSASLDSRYLDLANQYYYESPSLTSFPGEPFQLLWSYKPQTGLLMLAVPTSVYHEAMAMRLAERALVVNRSNADAISLWIAANFSREIDLEPETTDPSYGDDRREPMYYAVAAGSSVTQPVLARAIDDGDTQLARRAISAIERTAGGDSLWQGGGGRTPIVDALAYPDRRVQYESAIAVATAQPRTPFDRSDRIVPILGSAIRDASALFAVVIAGAEAQGPLKTSLEAQGYTVLTPGRSFNEVNESIARAPGVDLIMIDLPLVPARDIIDQARSRPRLRATPILALVDGDNAAGLMADYRVDRATRVVRRTASDRALAGEIEQLEQDAVGGRISEEDARRYKERALATLRDLAISGNETLDVIDASRPLITAMPASPLTIKLRIGEVLAHMESAEAQTTLMDQALSASGDERVALFNLTAESAKRWGNMLTSRQVSRLVATAKDADGDEATAAAALMGALDLPNDQLIPLIVRR